ncbi:type II toxin-antitoxin system HicA family toxin [Stomatobaculum longum]|uniref:type II toxin-antitoxin system HicA family toxin n=1 Tax=Stomatobaculum longum TaxID=796942 RepID=UPI0028DD2AA0|nr:type II toxin-antitoxin system HicA family toxin [Stomatobaculum longum]
MPTKEKLLQKLFQKRLSRNFTKQDLSALMVQCGCRKGRGGRILAFDEPHPENELYPYQLKLLRRFLREIGEYREDKTNDGV